MNISTICLIISRSGVTRAVVEKPFLQYNLRSNEPRTSTHQPPSQAYPTYVVNVQGSIRRTFNKLASNHL